jgi:mannose-6-phosphate isomerase-like protein (cupin superfamily)
VDTSIVKVIDFRVGHSRPVERDESRESAFAPIAATVGEGHLGCMYIGPNGRLGRHRTLQTQLFCVVSGEGAVSGGDGVFTPIEAGQAALWDAGEEHESSSVTGMTVLVLEVTSSIQPSPLGAAGDA